MIPQIQIIPHHFFSGINVDVGPALPRPYIYYDSLTDQWLAGTRPYYLNSDVQFGDHPIISRCVEWHVPGNTSFVGTEKRFDIFHRLGIKRVTVTTYDENDIPVLVPYTPLDDHNVRVFFKDFAPMPGTWHCKVCT